MQNSKPANILKITLFCAILPFLLLGCVTKDTVPTSFDRALNVRKKVVSLDEESKRIELRGDGLMNYAGCVEAFAIKADKVWKGAPYSYIFDAKEIERVIKPAIENPGYNFQNEMQLAIANDLGAYAGLYILLLEVGTLIDSQEWTAKEWQIQGITKRESKIVLDRNTHINVITPDDFMFKGKKFEGSGLRLANASIEAFAKFFDHVDSFSENQSNGVNVHINVIRWQDRHPLSGLKDIITAEYLFTKGTETSPLGQFLVIAKEPIFVLSDLFRWFPQNGSPEDFLAKPLSKKFEQFFTVSD